MQQWRITDRGGGYSTLTNRHNGLCLDNYNWGTTPGSEVRQWTCVNNNAPTLAHQLSTPRLPPRRSSH